MDIIWSWSLLPAPINYSFNCKFRIFENFKALLSIALYDYAERSRK